MKWIGTAWLLLIALPVTAFYATWAVLASWAGIRYSAHNVYDRIMVGWSRIILRANGVRVRAVGLERLDPNRSYVFVANHTSVVDIWVLLVAIPHSFRFLAKQELSRVPILGKAMDSAGNIFIDRHNLTSAFASYEQAATLIRAGMSAMVFAEGTRSLDGRLLPFKKGPFVLAIQAGVPLVPLYIDGAFERTPKGALYVQPGEVVVRVAPPIPTAGLSHDDRARLSEEARAAMIALGAR